MKKKTKKSSGFRIWWQKLKTWSRFVTRPLKSWQAWLVLDVLRFFVQLFLK